MGRRVSAAFAHQTFARQTFGWCDVGIPKVQNFFGAAHLQNVPVQKVECKVCCKRLAALAFSPNVLHARSKTFGCERSNVKSGLTARSSKVSVRGAAKKPTIPVLATAAACLESFFGGAFFLVFVAARPPPASSLSAGACPGSFRWSRRARRAAGGR